MGFCKASVIQVQRCVKKFACSQDGSIGDADLASVENVAGVLDGCFSVHGREAAVDCMAVVSVRPKF